MKGDDPILAALRNPTREAIMRNVGAEPTSPKRLSETLHLAPQGVNWHVRVLAETGLLADAGTRPSRGAVEHFYTAAPDAGERIEEAGRVLVELGRTLKEDTHP